MFLRPFHPQAAAEPEQRITSILAITRTYLASGGIPADEACERIQQEVFSWGSQSGQRVGRCTAIEGAKP